MPDHLAGSSTPIDGRTLSDLLNYFAGLSGQINFYNEKLPPSDWQPFFKNHLPFQLSHIDTYTGDSIKKGMASAVELFHRNPSANGLQLLFLQTYYTAIYPLQQWSTLLAPVKIDLATQLAAKLNILIKERLSAPVKSYIKWLNTAVHCWGIQPPDLSGVAANQAWGLTPALMAAYEDGFSCIVKSTRSQLLTVQTALTDIVNAFADVVETGSNGVADLVNNHLFQLLENNGDADTPPQLAVLYTFLFQFRKVLSDLNGLTQKQLDYFFQQVLALSPGPSIPDQAYLVFNIQKQLAEYTIDAGTSLKAAGKDAKGADIYFQLNAGVTVNQAQVAAVQTVFVNKRPLGKNTFIEGVYRAPDARMADGVDKSFADPATAAWPSLGAKQSLYTPPGAISPIDYPYARIGFVLASKALYLKEGKRKVHIQLVCEWDPGQGACDDGVAFDDLFELAKQSVCARYVVITPDVLDQAARQGVYTKTIAAMRKEYLEKPGRNGNPCEVGTPSYRDRYLLRIPCCQPEKRTGDPAGSSGRLQRAQGAVVEVSTKRQGPAGEPPVMAYEAGIESPGMTYEADAESSSMQREAGLEFQTKTPAGKNQAVLKREEMLLFEVNRRCPDDLEEEYCKKTAQTALLAELESVVYNGKDGKAAEDVKVLQQLLVFQSLFDVQFSGEKGWQAPDYLDMRLEQLPAAADGSKQFIWHIHATIHTGSPGIVFYDKTKLGEDLHVTDPLVKVQLNPAITWTVNRKAAPAPASCIEKQPLSCEEAMSPYEFFRHAELLVPLDTTDKKTKAGVKTKIDVTVCGVKTLVVQNDANLMDANKAFTPFGAKPLIPDFAPVVPSGKPHPGTVPGPNFYVGSTEVFLKKWKELYLNMNWLSKPASFTDYYAGYAARNEHAIPDLDPNYTVSMALLDHGIWHERAGGYTALFPICPGGFPECCNNQYTNSFKLCPPEFPNATPEFDPAFAVLTKWTPDTQGGFLRMTLEQQDFLHKYYPTVMGKSIRTPDNYPKIVNEPWTPTILPGMSIDYKATAEAEDMSLVQLYPFDSTSRVVNMYGTPTLMACICDEGNLYIGLTGLVPGQGLNVLFQLAEATAGAGSLAGTVDSADPGGAAGSASPAGTIKWQYLSNNDWKDLRSGFELVVDGTQGLTRTGIIQFRFPDDITNSNTVLPAGNYWIAAEMSANTASTSRTMDILPQAGLATYAPVVGVNDPARSASPLDKNSITKLTQADANVVKVIQPYPSFGGSAPEDSGNAFAVRVSERLRHKGRAIQAWDFERLVLQQFPQLLRVKCINHSYFLDSTASRYDFPISPGNILLAVLPDTRQLSVVDQLAPTVPTSMLTAIAKFLQNLQSPFVTVTVANPRYEPLNICATVRFVKNADPIACSAQLQQKIQGLLAPWLGGDLDEFEFSKLLYYADVADLIQREPYVANMSKLTMGHADETASTASRHGYIAPRTPRSILVAGTIFVGAEDAAAKAAALKAAMPDNTPNP